MDLRREIDTVGSNGDKQRLGHGYPLCGYPIDIFSGSYKNGVDRGKGRIEDVKIKDGSCGKWGYSSEVKWTEIESIFALAEG